MLFFTKVAVLVFIASVANANMFDVAAPLKLPGAGCSNGCASWADQNDTIKGDFHCLSPPSSFLILISQND